MKIFSELEKKRAARLLIEIANRKREALMLYEPLFDQERFHASWARERIISGGNRAGKTLLAAVEVARAVTGQDPYGKYPARDGRIICVGLDLRHIGQVMWRKLARAGAFRMVRDPETDDWRSYRPWQPWDAVNYNSSRLAPPLIPQRWIASISWKEKKANIPAVVRLKTGWEMLFASSDGKPHQGIDVDLVWFDEELTESTWYEEMAARLVDRRGRFIWSVTPQMGTEHLDTIHARAVEGDPGIEEFTTSLYDNPHVPEEEKLTFARKLSPEDIAVRIYGKYASQGYLVFPSFSTLVHTCSAFEIPRNWTRYAAVDPGVQICAVIFLAVGPHANDQVFVYDELYIRRCSAELFGKEMVHKAGSQVFEAFLIDSMSGKAHDIGSGKTVQDQYAAALAKHRITSSRTGSNFLWGSTDTKGGIEAMRTWLGIGEDGKPKLQILNGKADNLIWELEHYHYRLKQGRLTDDPAIKNDHAIWGLRALAAFNPGYVKPSKKVADDPVYKAFLAKQKKQKQLAIPVDF